MSSVTVRLWAAVAEATGHRHGTELSYAADSVADLLGRMRGEHGDAFEAVVPMCTVLVDGMISSQSSGDAAWPLPDGATVDLLPPFAGG